MLTESGVRKNNPLGVFLLIRIFIDGSAGTTGLRIVDRLKGRQDIEMILLPEELRKNVEARKEALCSADIMLLDEPFGALDVITRNDMQDWLLKLRRELGRTTLLVTHDIDEALYLADRIVVLGGKPACVTREIDLSHVEKSRDWLYEQTELRKEIFNILRHD